MEKYGEEHGFGAVARMLLGVFLSSTVVLGEKSSTAVITSDLHPGSNWW